MQCQGQGLRQHKPADIHVIWQNMGTGRIERKKITHDAITLHA
jgi:hypothetical protein